MEWEPKALSLDELKYAREAALYVLSTHSSEDAVQIFTQGLKPVVGVRKNFIDSDSDDNGGGGGLDDPAGKLAGEVHRHQYENFAEQRDIATAPF